MCLYYLFILCIARMEFEYIRSGHRFKNIFIYIKREADEKCRLLNVSLALYFSKLIFEVVNSATDLHYVLTP